MTNQLETAKEWLSDLNKIIDKTDNECTKQKRDVLDWLVKSVEELEKQADKYKSRLETIVNYINTENKFDDYRKEWEENLND